MTKICNIMTKRPSSLYTETREWRLPGTHKNIINKQPLFFLTTTIIRQRPLRFHRHLPQLFDHPNDDHNVATPRYQPNGRNNDDGRR